MTLRYKVIGKGKPGVAGGGEKKYYARIEREDTVPTDELIRKMCEGSSLNRLVCIHVFTALQYTLPMLLAEGRPVKIDQIGTFYPTVKTDGRKEPQQVKPAMIDRIRIRFRPATELQKAVNKNFRGAERAK